jgi:hypothetical protein
MHGPPVAELARPQSLRAPSIPRMKLLAILATSQADSSLTVDLAGLSTETTDDLP